MSRGSRSRARRVAAGIGVAALAAYVAGAWLSGSLSPLARRALLDTSFIPQPYRWVTPPPKLAAGNRPPDSGDFTITFSKGRSDAGVFATNDQQASVILSVGAIPTQPNATSVHLTIDPLDPASLGPLPDDLHVLGNAYRVEATYQPTGDPVTRLVRTGLLILVYPALVTHGTERAMTYAPDGTAWSKLKTTDDATNLQASSNLRQVNGDYEVAANGAVVVGSPTPGGGSGGGGTAVAWVVIAAAIVVAVILVVIRLRARSQASGAPPAAAEPPAATGAAQRKRRGPPPKRKRR